MRLSVGVVRVAARNESGLEQLHVYFPADDAAPRPRVTLFVFDGPGDVAFEETIERTLASVRSMEPGAPHGAASVPRPGIDHPRSRRYEDAHVLFEVPLAWVPSTIAAFVAPAASSSPPDDVAPNVLVTREPRRDGDTLRDHALRNTEELEATMDHFVLLEARERVVGGRPAIEKRFRWRSPSGRRVHTMVHLDPAPSGGRDAAPVVTTLTLTDRPRPTADGARAAFESLLRSVRYSSPPVTVRRASSLIEDARARGWSDARGFSHTKDGTRDGR